MAEQQNPALNPLPLGLPESTATASATPTGAAVEPLDPVSQWLEENPKFEEPAVTPEPQATAAPEVPASPETPATETPAAATTTTPAPAATTTTTPEATTQPTTTAQPETKPAAPATTLAGDEKIKLTGDTEWTRDQIVEALKDRATAAPLAKEAEGFRTLFGMPLEEAQRAWGPVMQRLAAEPKTVAFLDAYLADPKKAEYLEQCAAHFDEKTRGTAPAATAATAPAVDPRLASEVKELRAWREQQERQAAQDRFNREWAQATAKYPFLATDKALQNDLALTAQALFAQDNTKGLLDAIALKAALYDAKLIASQAPAAAVTTAPAVAPQPQPAVLGSSGASPTGTRQPSTRPKSFGSLDDAVDDWVYNPPSDIK